MSQKQAKEERKKEAEEMESRRKAALYTVQQRFTLLNMMPAEGEYFNMRNSRLVKEECAMTDKEQVVFVGCTILIPGGTRTNWVQVHREIPSKLIDVGEWLASHFRTILKKQFDENKIKDETVELYDIFCGPPQE